VKYRDTEATRPAWRAMVSLMVAAAFPLMLAACADDDVRELDAQGADQVAEVEPVAPGQAAIAPEDTMTRTAADAASMAFAARGMAPPAEPIPDTGSGPNVTRHSSEDPEYAARHGWPVQGPAPLPGALLPDNRIVCYYGNPNSTRMGALGEYPKDEMLSRLRRQIAEYERADPSLPVTPCLHLVAVVAQGEAGTSGHYRSIMRDESVQMVYDWAREVNGIFIVDIQVGTDDIRNILPRFEWILQHPDVHLGIDPEFYMKDGSRPGSRIGTMDAADINYASRYLADLTRRYDLPPKVLVIHRFTQRMVTNYQDIELRPEVQVVMHMDGWGAPWLKRDTYRDYIIKEPVQYTGFKIFYHNDTRNNTLLMQPEDVLRLHPAPVYIQYQ
jgi:hypothetical protein